MQKVSQVSTTLNENHKTLAPSITYLPFGGMTGLTYGNTLTLAQGYDNQYQYRIFSITVGSLLNRTYGYDANGNVTSIVDAIQPTGNEALEMQGTYTYFPETNLLDQITGESPKDFGYDQNGNTTTENTRVYVYDALYQLIQVQDIADYVYNGAGQRIEKILLTGTRIFHYDLKGHIIAETNQSGQMLAEYIYLNDQLLAMIRPGENVYYYHNDHLGTPQILTNASGAIAWKANYTPFGEAEILVETVENPFRLPGQYYDQETGLHYNYFRNYSPAIGRYLTPDPIGLLGGINLWPYATNNPIRFLDRVGLLFDDIFQDGPNNPVNGVDPEGLCSDKKSYYVDFNVSIPIWRFLGVTFGAIVDERDNIYIYGGGGVVQSFSVALTASIASVTEGWNVGVQGTKFPWSGQFGYAFGEGGGLYLELGGGAGKPGASVTGFYIFKVK